MLKKFARELSALRHDRGLSRVRWVPHGRTPTPDGVPATSAERLTTVRLPFSFERRQGRCCSMLFDGLGPRATQAKPGSSAGVCFPCLSFASSQLVFCCAAVGLARLQRGRSVLGDDRSSSSASISGRFQARLTKASHVPVCNTHVATRVSERHSIRSDAIASYDACHELEAFSGAPVLQVICVPSAHAPPSTERSFRGLPLDSLPVMSEPTLVSASGRQVHIVGEGR